MIKIPLSKPDIDASDIQSVVEVLESVQLAFGQVQRTFEKSFAAYNQVEHAVAVSSGTAALHLAVQLSGVESGDEVIVSPFSFIASSNVVLYQQAKPIFVDIEEETLGLDPLLIAQALTDRTKAILPTHVFGQPCQIEQISNIAKDHKLTLIEDNCESLGATVKTKHGVRRTGQFGEFAAYGFYPNKLLTSGEGGMLTTSLHAKAEEAESLRNQGRSKRGSDIHLVHEQLGYNYRMSDIQSALGNSQLKKLPDTIAKRARLFALYNDCFEAVEGVQTPQKIEGFTAAWFVYYIRVDERIRDELIRYLDSNGVQSRAYFYPPIHLQPFYRQKFNYSLGDFPVAEKVSKEIIALPFHNRLHADEVSTVVDQVKKGLSKIRS